MVSHSARTALALLGTCGATALAVPRTVVFRDGEAPTPAYAGTRDVAITNEGTGGDNDPNATYGGGLLQVDGFRSVQISLVRWDVSTLPAGTVVEDAGLVLNVANVSSNSASVYDGLRAWSGVSATWNQAAAGVTWSQPGGQGGGADRSAAPVGSFFGASVGPTAVTLTPEGLAMVQRWVSNPSANFGVRLAEVWRADAVVLHSCEAATVAQRPRLDIQHSGGVVTSFQRGASPDGGYDGCTDLYIANGRGSGANLNGAGLWVNAGTNGLLRFDLGALPSTAQVLQVELVLYSEVPGLSFSAYPLLRPWTEAATLTTSDGTTPWASPGAEDAGADYEPLELVNGRVMDAGVAAYAFTDAGVAVVAQWLNGSRANEGMLLLRRDFVGAAFRDREIAEISTRPALRITYEDGTDGGEPDAGALGPLRLHVACGCGGAQSVPALGALGLWLAALGLAGRRRRR